MEQPSRPCEERIISGDIFFQTIVYCIAAIKSLNSFTAPFPSASGVLRRYRNRRIIIIIHKRGLYIAYNYKLRGSPAWKHTITQDIQAPWESSMEIHIHTRGGYTLYKLCESPALTQEDIQALWESSMETYNHTGYTSSVGVQHGNTWGKCIEIAKIGWKFKIFSRLTKK